MKTVFKLLVHYREANPPGMLNLKFYHNIVLSAAGVLWFRIDASGAGLGGKGTGGGGNGRGGG